MRGQIRSRPIQGEGEPMSVEVVTFGCRLNAYEGEVIRRQAQGAGLADAVIVNTCAVTEEAVRQSRQAIRSLKRQRPGTPIVVTGCAAQVAPETFAQMAAHLIDGLAGRARAFVQVQNGCDHRCTFCIIPYGRGNSRSVPMGEVIAQMRSLCARGYREIVLTGVDLTSYGANLPGAPKLGTLVKQIFKHVPEVARLRLSSIDSVEADRELLDAFGAETRLMPHLHLSLQAGDDLILKRMKRRHSRADAIAFCQTVRRLRPDVVFGADIIAGFPTETEEMFARSLDLVDDCGLTHLHVFPFSPRPGTPAARMPQVRRDVVKERARRLRAKGEMALRRHLEAQVGARRQVLIESGELGRTEHFTRVRLAAPMAPGLVVDVTVAGHDGRQLLAA